MENYTKIFRENGGYILSRTNMKTIQEILPEENFLRIHRSYIVPIENRNVFQEKNKTYRERNISPHRKTLR